MRKATIFNVLRKGTLANEPEKRSLSPVQIRAASNLSYAWQEEISLPYCSMLIMWLSLVFPLDFSKPTPFH